MLNLVERENALSDEEVDEVEPVPGPSSSTSPPREQLKSLFQSVTPSEWREAQSQDPSTCKSRFVELKRSWGDPPESEVRQRETPGVLAYCHWWHSVHQDEDGI